ncbi:conserved membrane hypothetical protein [Desulfovibrionales bacterium]
MASDLCLTGLLSALVFSLAHYGAFLNPFVINDDVRQQVAWIYQWRDPTLFVGDYLTEFARHYVAWGVRGLYWAVVRFIDPVLFSKFLTGGLFIWLGLVLFLLGNCLGGRKLGHAAVVVLWCTPFFLHEMSGGLSRSFAPPLLAQFAWAMVTRRPWTAIITLFLQALCIPYIFVLSATTVVLSWFGWRFRFLGSPTIGGRWWHYLILIGGAALVWAFGHELEVAGYGPMVGSADIIGHEEFSKAGRLLIFPVPSLLSEFISPWEYILSFRDGGILSGMLVSIGLLWIVFAIRRRISWYKLGRTTLPLLPLAAASILLYFLACRVLLKLFVPSRYVEYSINLSYLLLLGCILQTALVSLSDRRTIALVLLFATALFGGLRLHGAGLYDFSADRLLYERVAQLPKGALLAGHPYLMDNVFTFSHRRALITFELAQPWCKGLWKNLKPRIEDLLHAYYADDATTVRLFCRKYDIDFFIIDLRHFHPDFFCEKKSYALICDVLPGPNFFKRACRSLGLTQSIELPPYWERLYPACPPFFAPFDRLVRDLTLTRTNFVLLNNDIFPAEHIGLFQRLIDVRSLRNRSIFTNTITTELIPTLKK